MEKSSEQAVATICWSHSHAVPSNEPQTTAALERADDGRRKEAEGGCR